MSADSNSANAPILSPLAYFARPCATRRAAFEGEEAEDEGEEEEAAMMMESFEGTPRLRR